MKTDKTDKTDKIEKVEKKALDESKTKEIVYLKITKQLILRVHISHLLNGILTWIQKISMHALMLKVDILKA